MNEMKIPVGRSGFTDIRKNGYYLIDKSRLIEELLKTDGIQAILITRPRRFGKTLNMSMLSEFFDIQKDSRELFAGLVIAKNSKLCSDWMNQYPTLFLSFRTVDGLDFQKAYSKLEAVFAEIYQKNIYLLDSKKINSYEKEIFDRIASKAAKQEEIENGLLLLTKMMSEHYGKPVILLIDEYDVPLAKASEKGYYAEMLNTVKGIMQVIKDNNALKYSVVTGCLQIAKESIFTGTNNFVSDTISDTRLNEYFGFTQAEVNQILLDYELSSHEDEIREWYDGYCFGRLDVYCPWDVMNHINNLILDSSSKPKNFWENTSDNSVIRSFIDRTDFDANDKFEILMSGGYIKEKIAENLTYDMLKSSQENLWSLLYFTGYLTRVHDDEFSSDNLLPEEYALRIPNREIMGIFKNSIKAWLLDKAVSGNREEFFDALWNGKAQKLTDIISDLLFDTISYYDYKESFYHAFLTGLVANAGYQVESNYENGLGRSDLVVKDRKNRRAVVIEAKWAETEKQLEKECESALRQIEEQQYAKKIERMGFRKVIRLGIAFFQKRCLVKA